MGYAPLDYGGQTALSVAQLRKMRIHSEGCRNWEPPAPFL